MDPLIGIVALGAAGGGFVQGLSGFAFGLVAMALWAWLLDPVLAGPLVVFGSLVGQLLSLNTNRRGLEMRRILPFLAGDTIGVPLGVALLKQIDPLAFGGLPSASCWRSGAPPCCSRAISRTLPEAALWRMPLSG